MILTWNVIKWLLITIVVINEIAALFTVFRYCGNLGMAACAIIASGSWIYYLRVSRTKVATASVRAN